MLRNFVINGAVWRADVRVVSVAKRFSARLCSLALMLLAFANCARPATTPSNPTPAPLGPVTGTAPLAHATSAAANAPTDPVALESAVIPVNVTYVLRALRPALDSLFPMRDSLTARKCEAVVGLVCHRYVYRRDSLTLTASGTQLHMATALAYRAQVGVLGTAGLMSCGYAPEAPRRATLTMSTSLYWRRDWRIGARDSRLQATLTDACRVTAVGVNGTRTLQGVIDKLLAEFAAEADSTIPLIADFRPLADSLWKSFLDPMPLDTAGTVWLMLEPQAVQVTPFVGTGPSITTSMVLYARPHIVTGAKPARHARSLPPLALVAGRAPAAFTVPVSIELPFADIAQRATTLMAAEPSGGVHVDSMHLRGHGDTISVDLDVSGSMRGRLSMTSRLRWDAATRELRFEDLDWTLATRGVMSRLKATLGAPLVSRAVRRATMGGRVPLGAQLDSMRTEMMMKLNGPLGPGITMGSGVGALQVIAVSSTPTAMLITARLTGTSNVFIQR
jgi:hypothetical protein